jgi:hypothetical protein
VKEDHPDQHFPWSEAKESKAEFNLPGDEFPDGTKVKLVIKTINGEVSFGEFDVEA